MRFLLKIRLKRRCKGIDFLELFTMESLNRGIMDFIHRSRKEWVFVLLMCNLIIVDNLPRLYAQQSSPLTKTDYDSLPNPEKAYMVIRGLEQDESKGYNPLHTLWNITSYLPKKIIHGIGYASGYSVRLINSQKFIDTVEDFLFTDDRSLGWYPLVDFTSSFRSRFGFNVVYRQRKGEALFRTNYAGKKSYFWKEFCHIGLEKEKQFGVLHFRVFPALTTTENFLASDHFHGQTKEVISWTMPRMITGSMYKRDEKYS